MINSEKAINIKINSIHAVYSKPVEIPYMILPKNPRHKKPALKLV